MSIQYQTQYFAKAEYDYSAPFDGLRNYASYEDAYYTFCEWKANRLVFRTLLKAVMLRPNKQPKLLVIEEWNKQ